MPGKPITLEPGEVYWGWTVIGPATNSPAGARRVQCQCRCGKLQVITSSSLIAGKTHGCLSCRGRRHGAAMGGKSTPEYAAWMDMHNRCRSKKPHVYPHYGARGITVCQGWSEFAAFLRDMGEKPSPQHELDRIDNDKGYAPENCRWATKAEQRRNTRRNHHITHQGRTMTIAEWARETGIPERTLSQRYHLGLRGDQLFTRLNLRGHYLTFHGQTQTITEWSRELGIHASTINHRLKSGLSIEQALDTS